MTSPLVLSFFVVIVNSVVSRMLRGARWTLRAPRLAILAWQALTLSVLTAGVFVGVSLVFPVMPASANLAGVLDACVTGLRQRYQTPGGQALAEVGGVVAVGIVIRVAYCLAAAWRSIHRNRAAQHQNLALTSRLDPVWRMSVVDHPTPAAYCIPGRHSKVVFTAGALARLDGGQIDAVLAHERAHLRGRHDLVLAMFGAFRAAFPRLVAMRLAESEVAQLLEMHADDVALRTSDRYTLARALVELSQGPVPVGAVSAATSALVRLRRLAQLRPRLNCAAGVSVAVLAMLMTLAPLAIMVEPAVAASTMAFCPLAG